MCLPRCQPATMLTQTQPLAKLTVKLQLVELMVIAFLSSLLTTALHLSLALQLMRHRAQMQRVGGLPALQLAPVRTQRTELVSKRVVQQQTKTCVPHMVATLQAARAVNQLVTAFTQLSLERYLRGAARTA